MASTYPIIIIGGGPCGLLLAQGLRKWSVPFIVCEKDEALNARAQGHRFRVHNEAADAIYSLLSMEKWDMLMLTRTDGARAPNLRMLDARDPAPLQDAPIRHDPSMSRGIPLDRSLFRYILSLGIEDGIKFGKHLVSYKVLPGQLIEAFFADGTTEVGSLLVGADGVWSRTRDLCQPQRKLLDMERQMIWARTPINQALKAVYPTEALGAVAGVDKLTRTRNTILEPMVWSKSLHNKSDGQIPDYDSYIYWTFNSETPNHSISTPDDTKKYVMDMTKGWHPTLRKLYELADYDTADVYRVVCSKPEIEEIAPEFQGIVALISDAAHPISPMGGLGGSAGIVDTLDLCLTIAIEGINLESIQQYDSRMRIRAKKTVEQALQAGKVLWDGKSAEEYKSFAAKTYK
ncbi:hypothetical protein F5884DRAFT_786765 [Xylogone sp. PMI_703]|nr:hypothetical protein F5884DRAFT_786765 [Xylogone sp. PMI_703]